MEKKDDKTENTSWLTLNRENDSITIATSQMEHCLVLEFDSADKAVVAYNAIKGATTVRDLP